MRIDFNVLWVEDQVGPVQSTNDRLKERLREEGFRLCTKFVGSVDEAIAQLDENTYKDGVDLILIDYDLGAGKTGDKGLVEVRNIVPYRDLVFYSGSAVSTLRKLAEGVEGVWISSRQDLLDIVHRIFEDLVRKVIDIDHARGIAIGATSTIDFKVFLAIIDTFNKCSDVQKDQLLASIRQNVIESKASLEEELKKVEEITHVEQLEPFHLTYTSHARLRLLIRMLKLMGLHSKDRPHFSKYLDEVMPKRNDLAHLRVHSDGISRKLINKRGNEFSSSDMRDLRIQILEFEELLDALFGSNGLPNEADLLLAELPPTLTQ